MHFTKMFIVLTICVAGSLAASAFQIISPPQVVEAKLGDKVTLPCEYRGRPEGTYRLWFHDQNVVSVNDKVIYRKDDFEIDGMNLIVTVSKPVLADKYICKFNDPEWSNVTHSILLLGPPVIDTDAKDIDVRANGTITIHCSSSSAPKPVITYKKQGSDIDLTPFVKDGVLQINNVRRKHAGVYQCSAKNGHLPDGEKKISVRYEGAPDVKVAIQWHNLNSEKDKSVEITCKVASEQSAKIQWLKGKQELKSSENFVISDKPDVSTLRVNSISKELFDSYTCRASNDHGSEEDSVEISSLPIKPNVVINPTDVTASMTFTTVSPYRVTRFLMYYQSMTSVMKTVEYELSENEIGDADGKYTISKVLANLVPNTTYNGTVKAFTVMKEASATSAFTFKTQPSAQSSSAKVSSSLALLMVAVILRA